MPAEHEGGKAGGGGGGGAVRAPDPIRPNHPSSLGGRKRMKMWGPSFLARLGRADMSSPSNRIFQSIAQFGEKVVISPGYSIPSGSDRLLASKSKGMKEEEASLHNPMQCNEYKQQNRIEYCSRYSQPINQFVSSLLHDFIAHSQHRIMLILPLNDHQTKPIEICTTRSDSSTNQAKVRNKQSSSE